MDAKIKRIFLGASGAGIILVGIATWAVTRTEPMTERQKAEQAFQALQEKDETLMRERCKQPFGPSLTEREERNRKWCEGQGLLDP